MIEYLLRLAYLMAPVYCANMAPVLSRFVLKQYAVPLDFGLTWKGEPLFGSHKTVLGIVYGVSAAVLVSWFQFLASPSRLDVISYEHWPELGIAMGVGTILGDLVKSFVKRRTHRAPGDPWIPFDQIDYVIGALVGMHIFIKLSVLDMFTITILSGVGHVVINHCAYALGIRKEKW